MLHVYCVWPFSLKYYRIVFEVALAVPLYVILYDCVGPFYMMLSDCGWPFYCVWHVSEMLYDCDWPLCVLCACLLCYMIVCGSVI